MGLVRFSFRLGPSESDLVIIGLDMAELDDLVLLGLSLGLRPWST